MHATELVNLATEMALDGERLVKLVDEVSVASIHDYWTAARCRLDRWGRGLRSATEGIDSADHQLPGYWPSMVQETIIAEVSCRVFTAILVAHDHHHRQADCGAIARNVLLSHVDTRCRLEAAVRGLGPQFTRETQEALALLDAGKRWTDMLIGQLLVTGPVIEFAFDQERARDFSVETLDPQAAQLLRMGVKQSFRASELAAPFSPELNEQIAMGIIGYFPILARDVESGRVDWFDQVEGMAADTSDWVDELLRG